MGTVDNLIRVVNSLISVVDSFTGVVYSPVGGTSLIVLWIIDNLVGVSWCGNW